MSSDRNIEIAVSYVRDIQDSKIADFGARMIMIPASLEKQNTMLESPSQYRYHSGIASVSQRNLHGDENNTDSKKNSKKRPILEELNSQNEEYLLENNFKKIEGPIDLSASNALKIEHDADIDDIENVVTVKIEENVNEERKVRMQKCKQKKRKTSVMVDEEWTVEHLSERMPKQNASKKEEVLKAARSLFSKRTRTLYHWMYPDTSKGKLKAIVSAAWDTLSTTEKEFYVSQVLGRFGVPAGSLMVNPQLGGFQNKESPISQSLGLLATTSSCPTVCNDLEFVSHPSSISHNQEDCNGSWMRKRWRRHVNGEDYVVQNTQQHVSSAPNVIDPSYDEDEFADDPELTTELLQFRRAMGNSE